MSIGSPAGAGSKTLAEACFKADFEVHAYCLMRNHFHLVVETPQGNLVAGLEGRSGEHHAGELRGEAAEMKAERIIAGELERLGWTAADLEHRPKGDLGKLEVAARVGREATLPLKWIAARLKLGTWKSAAPRLRSWRKDHAKNGNPRAIP
jgi:hypothetical protein